MKLFNLVIILMVIIGNISMANVEKIKLWNENMPGAKKLGVAEEENNGITINVEIPDISVYLADRNKATGQAVVICPGGGYGCVCMGYEGRDIAKWLNEKGISAFVLKYRHKYYQHPIPLLDAKRAMRLVRYNAEKWNIDGSKIGILGFSAGGHLASSVGTHYDNGEKNAKDPIDRESSRPDFMILIYPVITMGEFTHGGSMVNLLGNNPSSELVEEMSNELQVTKDTPTTFLVHSSDDSGVPVENSINFYLALRKAGVDAEMHIYKKGGHGYGMLPNRGPAAELWPKQCEVWLKNLK